MSALFDFLSVLKKERTKRSKVRFVVYSFVAKRCGQYVIFMVQELHPFFYFWTGSKGMQELLSKTLQIVPWQNDHSQSNRLGWDERKVSIAIVGIRSNLATLQKGSKISK
jgi:hypothetical protein